MNKENLDKNLKKTLISVLFFGICVFSFYTFIVFNTNIHGDAKFHTLYAKESAESGDLVREQPYRLFGFDKNTKVYMPIAYPLTSEALFTTLYLFGGETALKLYAPLFATLIYLLLFLCLKELGTYTSIAISTISILTISERLIMTPLMEPFILVLLLSGCYMLKKYFFTDRFLFLFLSAIFFGTSAAVKQQGIILGLFIIFFILCYFIYKIITKKINFLRAAGIFGLFILVLISIPFLAIRDQIIRTGTFAFSPGATTISSSIPFSTYIQPILTSKFEINPKAMEAIKQTVTYNREDKSLLTKAQGFLLSPFLFYRASDNNYREYFMSSIFYLFISLLLIYLISRDRFVANNKFFFYLILGILGAEILGSYILKTPITQYHIFGVLLSSVFVFILIFRSNKTKIIPRQILLVVFSIFFIIGYVNYIYPLWKNSGRENDYHLEGYKRIGKFVQETTPPDSIFFAAETSFRYYAKRDTVWLNENFGDITHNIVTTNNDKDAVTNLHKLNIDYVMINRAQAQRYGVNDHLPPNGLISIINKSKYFTKVFDAYGDNEMVIYKINN